MLGEHAHEKHAESYAYRRSHHVEREPKRHRIAGEIFGITKKNKPDQISPEPRGLGFANNDNFGPDDSWDTKDPLTSTPAPKYYKSYRSV